MKANMNTPTPVRTLSESDIRDYAYHLYLQSGCIPGRDLDNWIEAEARLRGSIPVERSQTRLQKVIVRFTEQSKKRATAERIKSLA